MWRIVAGLAAVMTGVGPFPLDAVASPRNPQPLRERYEPGETATLVGYTQRNAPLDGYLVADPCAEASTDRCFPAMEVQLSMLRSGDHPLGAFDLKEPTHGIRGLRMSLTFIVPTDLAPGTYYVALCRSDLAVPCFLSSSPLYVGVEPPPDQRIVYHWPLDDPAIADLPDDALLLGHDGEEVTAAQVRAGITVGDPDSTVRRSPSGRSVRTTDPAGDRTSGPSQTLLWLLAAALLVVAWSAMARLGRGRKQVRSGQG